MKTGNNQLALALLMICFYMCNISFGYGQTQRLLTDEEKFEWKNDSLGCNGARYLLVPVIMKSLEFINVDTMFSFLGEPNEKNDRYCFYFIQSECDDGKFQSMIKLNIRIKEGNAMKPTLSIYGG